MRLVALALLTLTGCIRSESLPISAWVRGADGSEDTCERKDSVREYYKGGLRVGRRGESHYVCSSGSARAVYLMHLARRPYVSPVELDPLP